MEVNATLNATVSFTDQIMSYSIGELIPRIMQLLSAPINNTNTLWMILPLLTMLLLMEFYFGRYSKEELGWNTAVGNSMVLVFVSIDLIRFLYGDTNSLVAITPDDLKVKTFIAACVAIGGIWLLIVNFFHIFPKGLAFFISSSLPINLMAYLAIILVYSSETHPIILDKTTFLSVIVIFLLLQGVFEIIKFLEPKSKLPEESSA
jgi:hypothetical protein